MGSNTDWHDLQRVSIAELDFKFCYNFPFLAIAIHVLFYFNKHPISLLLAASKSFLLNILSLMRCICSSNLHHFEVENSRLPSSKKLSPHHQTTLFPTDGTIFNFSNSSLSQFADCCRDTYAASK